MINRVRQVGFVLSLIVHTIGFSQDTVGAKKPLISRLELGIGLSGIRPKSEEAFEDIMEIKTGFTGGIGLIHEFNSNLELALMLNYTQKGYRWVVHSINTDYNPPADQKSSQDVFLNYVEITILPRYLVGNQSQFSIALGPYLGHLSDQRLLNEIYVDGSLILKQGSRDDLGFEEYDAGLTFQLGYQRTIAHRLLGIVKIVYSRGLMDIDPKEGWIKNQYLALMIGISKRQY